jgi:prepilin-type N-terminal cleavage/methylation domain-containing protein/prepilin-type processing-associated H-X9-DG protein
MKTECPLALGLNPRPRVAFTLIELMVVIAIVGIAAAILFPVFAQARAKARQATCASNLSQIGKAISLYRDDWDCYVPMWLDMQQGLRSQIWMGMEPGEQGLIDPYLRNEGVRRCPSRRTAVAHYCMNNWSGSPFGQPETSPQGQPEARVTCPASTLIVWEHQVRDPGCHVGQWGGTREGPNPQSGIDHWDSAHHGGFNALWCDGHVKRMSYSELRRPFFTIEEDPD